MEATSTIFIFMLGILTAMIVVVGIQAYHVLKDFRTTIEKANKVLDNTESITKSVDMPVKTVSNLLMNIFEGKLLGKLLSKGGEK